MRASRPAIGYSVPSLTRNAVIENARLYPSDFAFTPGDPLPGPALEVDLNLRALALMAGVHDALKLGGFTGHDLERLLVRILFCLFADKTGIFQPDSFRLFVENRTATDGSNLGAQLKALFATLDRPDDQRQHNLDEDLRAFPYVNGALFTERLESSAFTGPMRQTLLKACDFPWDQISPAIFGALFQEVINDGDRRKLGAHYTSERDILKVIRPLFLDRLREEFDTIVKDRSGRRGNRLEDFRSRLTKLKFLDPACGCGNFLVIAYRELRKLELDVLRAQHAGQQALTLDEVSRLSQVDVHQFYGIELEEWPARIAEVALWLMDHQANLRILEAFSQPFRRLPLKQSPRIRIENALRMDWNDLLPAGEGNYIMGNPPFVGKSLMSDQQKADMQHLFEQCKELKGGGVLDYVTAWYLKAAQYMDGTPTEAAFVSTNSISQGEQPGILWNYLFSKYRLTINFAYRTFVWESEARGKAHVHVVIIGFAQQARSTKSLFSADDDLHNSSAEHVSNIAPYLVKGQNVTLLKVAAPLCEVPPIMFGSMPNDGGHLILTEAERDQLVTEYPVSIGWIRQYMGADELLNGSKRYCLWLQGVSPSQIRQVPPVQVRIQKVHDHRAASNRPTTRALAAFPSLFGEIRQPESTYIILPLHSSQSRRYLPLQLNSPEVIASNACSVMPNANLYLFGILSSHLHLAWVASVAGRMARFTHHRSARRDKEPSAGGARCPRRLPRQQARYPLRPTAHAACAGRGAPKA